MPLEDSPTLDQYKDGMPPEPVDQSESRKRARIAIGVLTAIVVVIGAISFLHSDSAALLSGTGTVSGVVVDEENKTIQAEIYILGADIEAQTDANGHFQVRGVPAGQQTIVVAYQFIGREYPVEVTSGSTVNAGQIQADTTSPRPPLSE
jgi:hypothetical protein